jgi:hypothetical protein
MENMMYSMSQAIFVCVGNDLLEALKEEFAIRNIVPIYELVKPDGCKSFLLSSMEAREIKLWLKKTKGAEMVLS